MPAPPSDFRLYHGNDLELLAGLLAAELAKPSAAALLAPETILIPQPAMRRWLQKTLAQTHGVAANLRFLTPGEFVNEALAANLPASAQRELGSAAALRWRLWRLLADDGFLQAPVFAPLRPVLASDKRDLAAWALAGELAAAFEKYQAWRRDWLLRWDRGLDRDDWQAELWRYATRGHSHRAARLQNYLARFHGDEAEAPRLLPSRLFVFACQNVSPDVLRIIASAARAGPLHFYFVSPVRAWWGDLLTPRERLRVAPEAVFAADAEHPLLAANGAAGRDFIRLLFGYEAVHPSYEHALYVPPDPAARTGLLHRLQRDLLTRQAPPGDAAAQPAFDPNDRTLQVHACPTRLREVQVLHEQLRDLLEKDPTLQPRDIAVLTPDIDQYAAHVRAVFGDGSEHSALPYALGDASARAQQPAMEAFLQLLALPNARFAINEVLELLALPMIAPRFGLDAAQLDALRPWLRRAGARWGLNAEHRAQQQSPAEPAYTWAFALDRLLLGLASGVADENGDEDVHGIAALPLAEGDLANALDALLGGLRALARWQQRLARAHPARDWPLLLAQLLDEVFVEHPAAPSERQAQEALRQGIERFAREVEEAEFDDAIPPALVRDWFENEFSQPDLRQPLLTGGITFARMVPMRLLPFKAICLLGMNDGEFPRRDPSGGLNRLASALGGKQRQPGDRSIRDDDRLLFLQLFAAAERVFYLSYLGRDPHSGEATPPSLVVTELLDLAARYLRPDAVLAPTPEKLRAALTLEHPLQPFSPDAFGRGDARRLSYQANWRIDTTTTTTQALPPFATAPVASPAASEPLSLSQEDWRRVLQHPPRAFLRQRLDLRLPRSEDPLPDDEPFDARDGLQRQALQKAAFAALVARPAMTRDELAAHLLARALIAPGAVGRADAADLLHELRPSARRWREWTQGDAQTRPFELDLDGHRISGAFAPVHAAGLLQMHVGQAHGRNRLALDLDWLLWSALGERQPVHRLWLGEECRSEVLPPAPVEHARERLRQCLHLCHRAGREALPLMPKSAWAYVESLAKHGDEARAWQQAESQWRRRGSFGEGDDPDVRLALRGQDPFADAQSAAAQEFRALARQLFGAAEAAAHE